MSKASRLKWPAQQRIAWIAGRLRAWGHIRRVDVQREFGIGSAQASHDFATFQRLHRGAMKYDLREKRYVAVTHKLPLSESGNSELDAAHAKLNAMGVSNVWASGRIMTLTERLGYVISLEHHTKSLEKALQQAANGQHTYECAKPKSMRDLIFQNPDTRKPIIPAECDCYLRDVRAALAEVGEA
jgi:hypothetical protein